MSEPKIVTEITIGAMDDGNVALTVPANSNVWILRGIIAKALEAVNSIKIESQAEQSEQQ